MYYVYILKSKKDNKLYIGQTSNLEDRVKRHNGGRVLSTKHRRPLELIHSEAYNNRGAAVKRENYLKRLKSPQFIMTELMAPSSNG